jgi:hypothetical protein
VDPTPALDTKGFFRSLFDFGFTSLITTRIIRVLYALIVIVYSLGAVILFITGLASGKAGGILFAIIFVPLGYLIYLVLTRVWMEFLIILFRIGDDIHAIRVGGGGFGTGGGTAPGGSTPPGGVGPGGWTPPTGIGPAGWTPPTGMGPGGPTPPAPPAPPGPPR